MTSRETITWTTEFLDWFPWIETVDESGVGTERRAVINATLGTRAGSTYYETLAHDLEAVRTRTILFSDIFESEGGIPRSERELAATVTSRINGCVYCASVHARLYGNLSRDRTLVQKLLHEGVATPMPTMQRAVADLSSKLTLNPEDLSAADLAPLRDLGVSDLGILDLIQSASIFANANRLMLTLGEPAGKST
jgi:uncharacterized peroxidase-related enzyme